MLLMEKQEIDQNYASNPAQKSGNQSEKKFHQENYNVFVIDECGYCHSESNYFTVSVEYDYSVSAKVTVIVCPGWSLPVRITLANFPLFE